MMYSGRYPFAEGFHAVLVDDPEAGPDALAKIAEDNSRWLDRLEAIVRRARLRLVPPSLL